jgi:hypothetical protein
MFYVVSAVFLYKHSEIGQRSVFSGSIRVLFHCIVISDELHELIMEGTR